MQIKTVPASTLSAVSTLLSPYAPDLTASRLLAAMKEYAPDKATGPGRLVSVARAAELLAVSPWTVVRMIKSGQLKAAKVGHQWRIPEAVLSAMVEE